VYAESQRTTSGDRVLQEYVGTFYDDSVSADSVKHTVVVQITICLQRGQVESIL